MTTNNDGKIQCKICGQYFHRVSCHVNKAHGMSASEYKQKFGYKQSEGLCSERSRIITSRQSAERYRQNKMQLFIERSKNTKFPAGVCGRKLKKQTVSMADYTIEGVKETKIMDVFKYEAK